MHFEAARWTVAFLRMVNTEVDDSLSVSLAICSELLHNCVDDRVVEVEGYWADNSHAGLPTRSHVRLERVGLGD